MENTRFINIVKKILPKKIVNYVSSYVVDKKTNYVPVGPKDRFPRPGKALAFIKNKNFTFRSFGNKSIFEFYPINLFGSNIFVNHGCTFTARGRKIIDAIEGTPVYFNQGKVQNYLSTVNFFSVGGRIDSANCVGRYISSKFVFEDRPILDEKNFYIARTYRLGILTLYTALICGSMKIDLKVYSNQPGTFFYIGLWDIQINPIFRDLICFQSFEAQVKSKVENVGVFKIEGFEPLALLLASGDIEALEKVLDSKINIFEFLMPLPNRTMSECKDLFIGVLYGIGDQRLKQRGCSDDEIIQIREFFDQNFAFPQKLISTIIVKEKVGFVMESPFFTINVQDKRQYAFYAKVGMFFQSTLIIRVVELISEKKRNVLPYGIGYFVVDLKDESDLKMAFNQACIEFLEADIEDYVMTTDEHTCWRNQLTRAFVKKNKGVINFSCFIERQIEEECLFFFEFQVLF